MSEIILHWYSLTGALYGAVADPLMALSEAIPVPALAVLVLGLIGATAPCQLTTNAGALAYLAGRTDSRAPVALNAFAFLVAKVIVYSLLGGIVILGGRELIPVQGIVWIRRVLGPLMIVVGLSLLGVIRPRIQFGQGLAAWVEENVGASTGGAFALGAAFSLAFCPTLFLLFFVYTIPLALASPTGVLYPGLFALGTTVPLLALSAALGAGAGGLRRAASGAGRAGRWIRVAAGVVAILAGLNDTVTYWLL